VIKCSQEFKKGKLVKQENGASKHKFNAPENLQLGSAGEPLHGKLRSAHNLIETQQVSSPHFKDVSKRLGNSHRLITSKEHN